MNSGGGSDRKGTGHHKKPDGRGEREELLPNPVRPSEKKDKTYDLLFREKIYFDARVRFARDQ
jgi:hypothetical protein